MIKKAASIPVKRVSNLKDGLGDVFLHEFITEEESGKAGRLFAKTVIPPGNSVGLHRHQGDMEAYYILKGQGLLTDNDTEILLQPGDSHICRDGDTHALINTGTEDLEYIAIILYTKD